MTIYRQDNHKLKIEVRQVYNHTHQGAQTRDIVSIYIDGNEITFQTQADCFETSWIENIRFNGERLIPEVDEDQ